MDQDTNTGLPIILIHQGDSSYLQYSIGQAKVHNPKSAIYLIGDGSNSHHHVTKHICMSRYSDSCEDFIQVYRHYSTNDLKYERFCFERWFILLSFLREQQIQKCFYMDSDVMLYSDVTEEYRNFKEYDMAYSRPVSPNSPSEPCRIGSSSPHSLFLKSPDVLQQFCSLLTSLYTEPSLLEWLKCSFLRMRDQNLPGGVCDMTAFAELSRRGELRIGSVTEVVHDSTFDNNFSKSSHGSYDFEMQHGRKRVQWIKNQPFCSLSSSGQRVRFNSIHCQGSAKDLMPSLYRGRLGDITFAARSKEVKTTIKRRIKHIAHRIL